MKKGGTHVGIVISFAIFITFLVFLYSVLEPAIVKQKDKETLLNYLSTEIIKEMSTQLISLSVSFDGQTNPACIKINHPSGTENMRVITKNIHNQIKDQQSNENELLIKSDAGENLYKVYYSVEEFENSEISGLSGCQDGQIAQANQREEIFVSKVITFKEKYENDKETLKDELNVPAGSGFDFRFIKNDGSEISVSNGEISSSVYASEIPVQYVDSEANIKGGKLIIRVW